MLAVWGYVEADFQRDYGLDLSEALPYMSWRRFNVLLNGLSPFGSLATHYESALKAQRMEDKQSQRQAADGFWNMVTNIHGHGS